MEDPPARRHRSLHMHAAARADDAPRGNERGAERGGPEDPAESARNGPLFDWCFCFGAREILCVFLFLFLRLFCAEIASVSMVVI